MNTHRPETVIKNLKKGDRIIINHDKGASYWEFAKFERVINAGIFTARPMNPEDRRKFLEIEQYETEQYFDKV
jgi:hypothetical protein